jgi:hypothetical protein
MSGMGGGGGGGGTPIATCASISLKVTLNSPNAKVIRTLKKDDELSIQLKGTSVVAVTDAGEIAGAITFAGITEFKKCLEQGHEYIAIVVQVHQGNCEVLIQYNS